MSTLQKMAVGAVAIIALILGFSGGDFGGTTNYDDLAVDSITVSGASTLTGAVSTGNFTQGGACTSTSTSGILTEAVLIANNCITMTATGAGQAVISLTLPATSTMTTLIPDAGDCKDYFVNASALSAATTTTIVKGTGWDLVGLDATGAGTGADVIDGAEWARLTACRETDTDVTGFVYEYIAAD